jgi:FkbM family methyltransferase
MPLPSAQLNPMPLVAAGARRLQALQPGRPVKGLTRFSTWLSHWLPDYQGVIRLPDGIRLEVDSRQSAERGLLIAGDYQPALTHALKQRTPAGGACLDVGANLGFYALKFAQWVGPQGRVAAFEANPALAERIKRHVALNGFPHVDVVCDPVHREVGPVSFYISSSPGKSSIHASHVPDPVRALTLTAITLDTYLQAHDWPRLDAIKLDIEGNDCNALLGARVSLARFRPFIAFEYWHNTPREIAEETAALLDSLGYSLRGLLRSGRQIPFDWQQTETRRPLRHVDVIGWASDTTAR